LAQEGFRDMAVSDAARLCAIKDEVSASPLYNEHLAPTEPEERTWTTYNLAALWIGMAIVITTYTLASGLMAAATAAVSGTGKD
jgi:nucleobase:cation symporter-1, NCS1 family